MRDQKKGETRRETKKNREMRCKTKKMGRRDQDKKNGETRCKTKKWGDKMRDRKKWGDKSRDNKKNGETRHNTKRKSSPKASNGSLALLFFLLGFHGGRQGSSPDRGQSPVEWGDFSSVRSFVRTYVPPSGPSSQA